MKFLDEIPFLTVIFDMDGVICHTNPFHSKAFKVFFEKRGIYPTEAEFEQHMYGKWNSYIFSHFLKREIHGEELAAFEEEKEGLFREIYHPHIEPIPGFMDFIEKLSKDGIKLGVATSAPRKNMDLILGGLGIEEIFSSRLSSENVAKHKPDPEVYLTSMANLSADPERTIVFEDSYSGITAGKAAGCKVIGVLTSHRVEDLPTCTDYIINYL